jgi:acetyl esterase/lipase
MTTKLFLLLVAVTLPLAAHGQQERGSATWAAEFYAHCQVGADIVYRTTPQGPQRLDLYCPTAATKPGPVLVFFHGGGWLWGSKGDVLGSILPWVEAGWNVVNVNYRVAGEASAPAALEDCLCALKWVRANAQRYKLDLHRLVLSGASAGGELALMAGMIPPGSGLDKAAGPGALPRPAAIVSLSGIADLEDLMGGPHRQFFAARWIGKASDPMGLARSLSPIDCVRRDLPPILSVHGSSDPFVPYEDTVRFHQELTRAGVPNRLFTVSGGKHGSFTGEQYLVIWKATQDFLRDNGIAGPP